MEDYRTNSEQETEALAAGLAPRLLPGDVLAYRGGLGAGKTAFTRGLARGLGIVDDVSSPTFSLVHEYGGATPENPCLCHFDMYRIEDLDSLYSTGFFDYLDGRRILAIEWSENIAFALPDTAIAVHFERTGEHSRRIVLEGGGRF